MMDYLVGPEVGCSGRKDKKNRVFEAHGSVSHGVIWRFVGEEDEESNTSCPSFRTTEEDPNNNDWEG